MVHRARATAFPKNSSLIHPHPFSLSLSLSRCGKKRGVNSVNSAGRQASAGIDEETLREPHCDNSTRSINNRLWPFKRPFDSVALVPASPRVFRFNWLLVITAEGGLFLLVSLPAVFLSGAFASGVLLAHIGKRCRLATINETMAARPLEARLDPRPSPPFRPDAVSLSLFVRPPTVRRTPTADLR